MGGGGTDQFRDTLAGLAGDRITDFASDEDRIELARSVFGAVGPMGQLSASAFQIGSIPESASARILYNSSTGALFYDADGNGAGAAVRFASVTPGTTLTFADIFIV